MMEAFYRLHFDEWGNFIIHGDMGAMNGET